MADKEGAYYSWKVILGKRTKEVHKSGLLQCGSFAQSKNCDVNCSNTTGLLVVTALLVVKPWVAPRLAGSFYTWLAFPAIVGLIYVPETVKTHEYNYPGHCCRRVCVRALVCSTVASVDKHHQGVCCYMYLSRNGSSSKWLPVCKVWTISAMTSRGNMAPILVGRSLRYVLRLWGIEQYAFVCSSD